MTAVSTELRDILAKSQNPDRWDVSALLAKWAVVHADRVADLMDAAERHWACGDSELVAALAALTNQENP